MEFFTNKKNAETGNVLFIILIAVALLGALSFAVSQSGRGNVASLTEDKARLYASEIIDYSNAVAHAVRQLRLRGVLESELCFASALWPAGNDYSHAGCADNEHRIFHVDGGGITWANAPAEAMDQTAAPDNLWHIYATNSVDGVGQTAGDDASVDLLLIVNELNRDVCLKINDLLGVPNANATTPPQTLTYDTSALFQGSFSFQRNVTNTTAGNPFFSRQAACFMDTATSGYHYYRVLLPR